MNWQKRILALGFLVIGLASCGGSDGGGGSGSDEPQKTDASPAPVPTPVPASDQSTPPSLPLAAISIEDLAKAVGLADFAPDAATESGLDDRLDAAEKLSARGTVPYQTKHFDVITDSNNKTVSCVPYRMSAYPLLADLEFESSKIRDQKDGKSSYKETIVSPLTTMPSFATKAFLNNVTKIESGQNEQSEVYFGATAGQFVHAIKRVTRDKEGTITTLFNCVRTFTAATLIQKTACSWSMYTMGYATQVNDSTEEIYVSGLYSYTERHELLTLDKPDQKNIRTNQYLQTGADTASFAVSDQSVTRNVSATGVFNIPKDGTCSVASSSVQ